VAGRKSTTIKHCFKPFTIKVILFRITKLVVKGTKGVKIPRIVAYFSKEREMCNTGGKLMMTFHNW
jgi:hypothetical protein